MPKIALIPIDNRPVCYTLPKQIAELAKENELLLPDRSLLGSLTKNADINAILEWLKSLKDIDIFVVSLDTIAYGGLISSRRSNDSFEEIKSRISTFTEILKTHNAKVFAFSSIMRISNNNINEEEKEYWSSYGTKIFEYSYNLHKMEVTCDGSTMLACNCNATRIPDDILDDYLNTRKRNFEINKYYIELIKQGIFDTLVFSKDDCSEYGLNVKEANLLKEEAKAVKNVLIKTGADEIPLSLLSRAINLNKNLKIAPIYTNPNSIDKISKYEDISVEESVKSQIELAGATVSSYDDCDLVLLVNNFKNEQGELVMDVFEPLFDKELILPDKPYFIADILNANGSDNNFVKTLFKQESLKEFYGYSAWNTTGNTLGCALATALTFFGAKIPNEKVFKTLLITRFLDDWAYQANVRSKLRTNLENLSNTVLKVNMKEFEKVLFEKFGITNVKTEYKFPWKRFFEIEVSIQDIYATVPFVDILFCE
ncbi:MAG: DUF4127 family protein [Candidatus Gastranaerophilales bacterium]|nr:DUF4127 family protein [Candidatus Gastranaerophilales bacterium]